LVVGNGAVPLAELVGYRNCEYSVAAAMIRELVDSGTTTDHRYTPSNARREARKLDTQAMYEGWRKAYRDLKKQHRNMSGVGTRERSQRWTLRMAAAPTPSANTSRSEKIGRNFFAQLLLFSQVFPVGASAARTAACHCMQRPNR
jgi:hypothetical protein